MTPRPIDPRNHHNTTWDETSTPAPVDAGALADALEPFLRVAAVMDFYVPEAMPDMTFPRAECETSYPSEPRCVALTIEDFSRLRQAAALRNSAPQETRGDERTATITECINVKVLLTNIGGRSDDWIRGFDAGTNAFIDALEKLRTLATTLRGAGASMIDGLSPSDLANWTDNSNCNAGIALAASQQSPRLEREGVRTARLWFEQQIENAQQDQISGFASGPIVRGERAHARHCALYEAQQVFLALLSPDTTVVSSTDPLCPDCGRSLNGPTHATYCMVPSKNRDTK